MVNATAQNILDNFSLDLGSESEELIQSTTMAISRFQIGGGLVAVAMLSEVLASTEGKPRTQMTSALISGFLRKSGFGPLSTALTASFGLSKISGRE